MHKNELGSMLKLHINFAKSSFDSIIRFRYFSSLLTIAVIGISLAIPVFFYLLVKNVSILTENLELGKNINVYFNSEASEDSINIFVDSLKNDPLIKEVKVIWNHEGLAEFVKKVGVVSGDVFGDDNPLPHTIIVTPNESAQQSNELDKLVQFIEKNTQVETVTLDKEWFTKINTIISVLNFLCVFLGGILFLSLLLIVLNTISTRVVLHTEEIEVMKLVGATDDYICRNYAYIGFWYGLLGAFFAWWLASFALYITSLYFFDLTSAYGRDYIMQTFTWLEFFLLFAFSIVGCTIVSIFSAKRAISNIDVQ